MTVPYRPVRLPMYDWPELAGATREIENALTDEICARLGIASSSLEPWGDRTELYTLWTDPGLLLSQTCGYPLTHGLAHKVHLLGAPHYVAEGCVGPTYTSHLVVRDNSPFENLPDLKDKIAAFNNPDSQSGMNAFRYAVSLVAKDETFFGKTIESGSHLASMELVANKQADITAVDAVCWALARQELPELSGNLKSIGAVAPASGLPFITSSSLGGSHGQATLEAIDAVFHSETTEKSRRRLHIGGFSQLEVGAYSVISRMEREAIQRGYPVLA